MSDPDQIPRPGPGKHRLGKLWKDSRENVVAIATVIAALTAIGGVVIAYAQLHGASSVQRTEHAARQAAAVRAQAARVSGVVAGGGENRALVLENAAGEGYTRIVLYNHSSAPVYRAIVSLVFVQGAGPRTGQELNSSQRLALQRYLTTIPPGESEVQVSAAWAGMMASPGVEIAFTDQAGISWIRYSDGKLGQLAQTPASYYHLERGEVLTWGAVRPVEASRTTR